MKPTAIHYKGRTIPVTFFRKDPTTTVEDLMKLFDSMEFNLDFRRKLKKISSIELVGEVAVFKYYDGTKLYMEVC